MADLLGRRLHPVARIAAIGWLMLLAPAELATTLARLISSSQDPPGLAAVTLVTLRVLVTAAGLMLGRRLAARATGLLGAALVWAGADLGTLALVLATARLPTNRVPGDAPIVWAVYALAALLVIVTAAAPLEPDRDVRGT